MTADDLANGGCGGHIATQVARAKERRKARGKVVAYEAALKEVTGRLQHPSDIQNQFIRVQWRAGANRKCTIAERQSSSAMNRYYDSLPFDFNRVILHREEVEETGYINASLLESPDGEEPDWHYITSQGPLENTVQHFWEMVWEKKTPLIIMLTDTAEKDAQGVLKPMSVKYWSDEIPKHHVLGGFIVALQSKTQSAGDIIKRVFTVTNVHQPETSLTVTHYHYTGWKEATLPEDTSSVRALLNILDASNCTRKSSPLAVILCNSGIGRSMAFVAMNIMINSLRKAEDSRQAKEAVSIFRTLGMLRRLRNSAVHTSHLVVFIYIVLQDVILDMLDSAEEDIALLQHETSV